MPREVRDIFDRIFDEREVGRKEKEVEYEGLPELMAEDGEPIIFEDKAAYGIDDNFKSIILEDSDGVTYIKHEEGVDYEGENLREEYEKTAKDIEVLVREGEDESPYALPGRSTGNTIRDEWKRTKRIDFTGHEINRPADVAQLFTVYRNPAYEFFHVIFTKGNEIVAHNAITTGLPGTTMAHEGRNPVKAFFRMDGRMKRLGADGYYLLHNHPSGDVTCSQADIKRNHGICQ